MAPKQHYLKELDNDLVLHYKRHRLFLGLLGVLLPTMLVLGSLFITRQIEDSISDYYYTCLRDVFVVTLCAVSIFLITYKGYGKRDRNASTIAGLFGIITAFVPTNFSPGTSITCHQLVEPIRSNNLDSLMVLSKDCIKCAYEITPVPHVKWLGWVHLGCAAIFLLSLAYIAIKEFTLTTGGVRLKTRKRQLDTQEQKLRTQAQDPNADQEEIKNELWAIEVEREQMPRKVIENIFYRSCGWTIVVMLALLIPMFFGPKSEKFYTDHNLVFWAESVCLWAFGTSWIVKGV